MNKFKVGDRVFKARPFSNEWYCRWGGHTINSCPIGTTGKITNIFNENTHILWDGCLVTYNHDQNELEYEHRKAGYMKRRFILLQDTPEVVKGAIFEENNNQDFICVNYDEFKHPSNTGGGCYFPRSIVLEQKHFFEEVKPLWVRIADLSIFEDMLKKHKEKQQ